MSRPVISIALPGSSCTVAGTCAGSARPISATMPERCETTVVTVRWHRSLRVGDDGGELPSQEI